MPSTAPRIVQLWPSGRLSIAFDMYVGGISEAVNARQAKYHVGYYARNREATAERQAENKIKNRDAYLKYRAEYYAKNRDTILKHNAEYRVRHICRRNQ